MCNFCAQNDLFPQMRIFSENLLMSPEYWSLIGREPFLSLTWELDFSQFSQDANEP